MSWCGAIVYCFSSFTGTRSRPPERVHYWQAGGLRRSRGSLRLLFRLLRLSLLADPVMAIRGNGCYSHFYGPTLFKISYHCLRSISFWFG